MRMHRLVFSLFSFILEGKEGRNLKHVNGKIVYTYYKEQHKGAKNKIC